MRISPLSMSCLLAAITVFTAIPAAAQDAPKAAILGDFSLLNFNPTISGVPKTNEYGGGGAFTCFINRYLGVTAEFQGYGTVSIQRTVVDGDLSGIPSGTYSSQSNNFTYLFGPQVKFRAKRFAPFAELLLGGSNTNIYSHLKCTDCLTTSPTLDIPSQHPFTMALGGGLDLNVNNHVAIRVGQFDWLLTRYSNPFTFANNQNNFRFQTGIVVALGGK